jgi:MFS family permease
MHDHHEHEKQQSGPPFKELRQQVNIILFCAQVLSAPLRAWFTVPGTWGERFADCRMALGVIILLVGPPACFPEADNRPAFVFFVATVALLLAQRIAGVWRRRKGYRMHSQYTGRSYFSYVFSNEIEVKSRYEPGLALLVGLLLIGLSPGLGCWLIVAAFAQGLCVAWAEERDNARLRALRDQRLEQAYLMEHFREEVGEE